MISLFDMFKIGIGPSSSHTMGPMVAAGMFINDIKEQLGLDNVVRIQIDLYGSLAATGRGHATDTACLLGLLGFKADKIDTTKVQSYLEPVFNYKRLNLNHCHLIDFDYDEDIVWHIQTNLPYHPNGLSFTAYTADDNSLSKTYYSIGGGFVKTEEEFEQSELPSPSHLDRRSNTGSETECDTSSDNSSNNSTITSSNKTPSNSANLPIHINNNNQPHVKDNKYLKDNNKDETDNPNVPYPFNNGNELIAQCVDNGLTMSQVMMANETALRSEEEVNRYLDEIWEVMQQCVKTGCRSDGILPGGLSVKRRAKSLHYDLLVEDKDQANKSDKLMAMDWVDLYALAVNEENANGGRVVTAPTNGAAGIIPAVMHYYRDFISHYSQQGAREFLLVSAAIGAIIKQNASISGAEVGCQGEVGSACAMAAAGLAHVLGLSPAQCANAAEIGIEHNLGLTCDPIGGLVQVPCIERNAMAAVKAINAARLAKRGDGTHLVSLDNAIATMKATGADMMDKYKETAMGGLAVQVLQSQMNLGDETQFDQEHPERINVVDIGVAYPQC